MQPTPLKVSSTTEKLEEHCREFEQKHALSTQKIEDKLTAGLKHEMASIASGLRREMQGLSVTAANGVDANTIQMLRNDMQDMQNNNERRESALSQTLAQMAADARETKRMQVQQQEGQRATAEAQRAAQEKMLEIVAGISSDRTRSRYNMVK